MEDIENKEEKEVTIKLRKTPTKTHLDYQSLVVKIYDLMKNGTKQIDAMREVLKNEQITETHSIIYYLRKLLKKLIALKLKVNDKEGNI